MPNVQYATTAYDDDILVKTEGQEGDVQLTAEPIIFCW